MNTREIQVMAMIAQFERASAAVVAGAGVDDAFISGQNQQQALPDSRTECLFIRGGETERGLSDAGDEVPCGWTGILEIGLFTNREQDQPSQLPQVGTLHQEFQARVDAAMLIKNKPFGANLPDYSVTDIKYLPAARGLDGRFFEDFTKLRYEIQFSIRDAAWTEPVA